MGQRSDVALLTRYVYAYDPDADSQAFLRANFPKLDIIFQSADELAHGRAFNVHTHTQTAHTTHPLAYKTCRNVLSPNLRPADT